VTIFRVSSVVGVAGLVAGMVLSASAMAQQSFDKAATVRVGLGKHWERYELAWETPSFWQHSFSATQKLELKGELGAAYWNASGSRTPSNVWQASATPFLRYTFNDRYFVEAGIGATVFSRTRFADKDIGSAFQFGSHVGLGMNITPASSLSLRVSHYSNAGIKSPNPGLDVVQLGYSYKY
jgi:lipid A 3-O-deacylase